jgi:hypothetical protein
MSKRRIVIALSVLTIVMLLLYAAHSMNLVELLIEMHRG